MLKKRILPAIAALFVLVLAVLLIRTFTPATDQSAGEAFDFRPDSDRVTRLMSESVRFKTISFGRDKPTSTKELLAYHAYLKKQFPLAHKALKREVIAGYSLLYTWQGAAPVSDTNKPVIFLGHLDVVPVVPGTEDKWKQPPFKGVVADGFIWGRGTLDNKVNIVGLLEAAENMLQQGLQPQRTIYFAFGHDEEQGGIDGAKVMADVLLKRGVQAEFLVDEGGLVTQGVVPGIDAPMALIAPAEKGIVTLQLKVVGEGGHSSMPPEQTSIGVLAAAIAALEANQFPRDFSHTQSFLEAVADDMPFSNRLVMKNLWLFKPMVMGAFEGDKQAQAGMRTTTAATMIAGGIKANVLPIDAAAKVNFRILPGETPETVRARVTRVINDARVEVTYDGSGQNGMAPSPISPTQGFGWEQLTSAIRDTAAPQRMIVTPRLLVAATDTRHYRKITPNHYRFTYMQLAPSDLASIHGTNERISVATLNDTVRFYFRMMSRL
ncbi:M20/M25/M40 family metallo-hydrolase [Alphaproteobacteria bacterium]|nr:M20/M25/M40 family metallo-hydrolase [Alphaproteobacteria bacterium]